MLHLNNSGISAASAGGTAGGEHACNGVGVVKLSKPLNICNRVGVGTKLGQQLENNAELSGAKTYFRSVKVKNCKKNGPHQLSQMKEHTGMDPR
jgi:hypothetical protein